MKNVSELVVETVLKQRNMEVILNCYFDQIFSELARGSLTARYKRKQIVDYFKTIIEACTSAGQCTEQEGCRHAVLSAIKYHDQTKSDNGTVCLLGKYHNVLYVAVKLCYDYQLDDTLTVARLLDTIYKCENTFERLFAGAIFGIRVSHFIAGWKCDFKDQNENITALSYFLTHATKAKLTYIVNDTNGSHTRRFLDVPMLCLSQASPLRVALQVPQPEVVLLLLRFGSSLNFKRNDVSSSPLEPILKQLFESCRYREKEPPCYPVMTLRCLKIVLRAVNSIDCYPASLTDYSPITSFTIHLQMLEDKIIPETRSGQTPSELKQLCRCCIRHYLWLNWQLPFGIQKLKLPERLKNYLDLYED